MLPLRIEIEKKGRKPAIAAFDLPQCWNEVLPDAYPHLASLYLATDKQMGVYDKTVRAFDSLTVRHWHVIQQLQPEELYELLKLIDWVFNKLDLSVNKIPGVKIGNKDYIGPGDELETLRFGEWCIADQLAMDYGQSGDIKILQQLAAVLYRPAGTGAEYDPEESSYRGDRREKFNIQLLDARTKLMAKLERPVLQGIYLFFVSCRQQIIGLYPNLFPALKNDNNADDVDTDGWLGLYDDLRGDPKFGGAEKLEEEGIHSVFFSMERSIIKNKKLREEYNL